MISNTLQSFTKVYYIQKTESPNWILITINLSQYIKEAFKFFLETMKSLNAFPASYSGNLNVLCLWGNHEHSSVVTEMRTCTCASPVRPRKDVSSRDPSLFNIYCCPETLPNCFFNYPSISRFTSCLISLCTQLLVLSWIVA